GLCCALFLGCAEGEAASPEGGGGGGGTGGTGGAGGEIFDASGPDGTGCGVALDIPDDQFVDSNCDGIDGDAAHAVFVATDGDDGSPGAAGSPGLRGANGVEASNSIFCTNDPQPLPGTGGLGCPGHAGGPGGPSGRDTAGGQVGGQATDGTPGGVGGANESVGG